MGAIIARYPGMRLSSAQGMFISDGATTVPTPRVVLLRRAGMHQRPCHCVKLLSAEYTARLRAGHLSCIYPARPSSHGCPSAVV
ncbi:unnamed protein product [Lampetra planeri]